MTLEPADDAAVDALALQQIGSFEFLNDAAIRVHQTTQERTQALDDLAREYSGITDVVTRELDWAHPDHERSKRGQALQYAYEAYVDISGRLLAVGAPAPLAEEVTPLDVSGLTRDRVTARLDELLRWLESVRRDSTPRRGAARRLADDLARSWAEVLGLIGAWDRIEADTEVERHSQTYSARRMAVESAHDASLGRAMHDLELATRGTSEVSLRLHRALGLSSATTSVPNILQILGPDGAELGPFSWIPAVHGCLSVVSVDERADQLALHAISSTVRSHGQQTTIHLCDLVGAFHLAQHLKPLEGLVEVRTAATRSATVAALHAHLNAIATRPASEPFVLWIAALSPDIDDELRQLLQRLSLDSLSTKSAILCISPAPIFDLRPQPTPGGMFTVFDLRNAHPTLQVARAALPARLALPPTASSIASITEWVASELQRANAASALRPASLNDLLERSHPKVRTSHATLRTPVGFDAHGEVIELPLGEGTSHHALVLGQVGSGKSSLLHTLVLTSAHLYGPEELNHVLVDLKEGVEFKVYASSGRTLPTAQVVAVHGRVEFALSVLRGLESEMRRRGELFRSTTEEMGTPTANITAYRQASGRALPRIMVVIDEFQVLFDGPPRQADEAEELLTRLVRQGRSAGIHLVLATQTIRSTARLRPIIDQMAIRVVLKSSAADRETVLSDVEDLELKQPGDAILNDQNGMKGSSRFLRVAYSAPEHQLGSIGRLVERDTGCAVQTRVFDGSIRPASGFAAVSVPGRPVVTLGEPFSLDTELSVRLTKSPGSNVLIVGSRDDISTDVLLRFVGAMSSAGGKTTIIESPRFDDAGEKVGLSGRCAALDLSVTTPTRRELATALDQLIESLDRESSAQTGPHLLVLDGLHRLRDLHPGDMFSDTSESLAGKIETLLRFGPEAGIHVVAAVDNWRRVSEAVTRPGSREFGIVVLQKCTRDDSIAAIGSDAASIVHEDSCVLSVRDGSEDVAFRPFTSTK